MVFGLGVDIRVWLRVRFRRRLGLGLGLQKQSRGDIGIMTVLRSWLRVRDVNLGKEIVLRQ